MTNQIRMTNIQMTKQMRGQRGFRFVIRSFVYSSLIRHSNFVIRHLCIALCFAAAISGKSTFAETTVSSIVCLCAVQPQVAVDGSNIVHLIYLTGDPAHADILYTRSTNNGTT